MFLEKQPSALDTPTPELMPLWLEPTASLVETGLQLAEVLVILPVAFIVQSVVGTPTLQAGLGPRSAEGFATSPAKYMLRSAVGSLTQPVDKFPLCLVDI